MCDALHRTASGRQRGEECRCRQNAEGVEPREESDRNGGEAAFERPRVLSRKSLKLDQPR